MSFLKVPWFALLETALPGSFTETKDVFYIFRKIVKPPLPLPTFISKNKITMLLIGLPAGKSWWRKGLGWFISFSRLRAASEEQRRAPVVEGLRSLRQENVIIKTINYFSQVSQGCCLSIYWSWQLPSSDVTFEPKLRTLCQ